MPRKLKDKEKELISRMLEISGRLSEYPSQFLSCILVEESDDGGMGSLQFLDKTQKYRKLGSSVCNAEFLDEDGVVVSAVLNFDQNNKIFELDIWKVDFSPLKAWPELEKITFKNPI